MRIEVPGLRGADALGFLAAIGLLSLSEQAEIPPIRLAWKPGGSLQACVDGELDSRAALAASLREAFQRLLASGSAIPGMPPGFPLKGSAPDPMRMGREAMRRCVEDFGTRWLESDDPWPARWLIAIAAQTAVDSGPRLELTPFNTAFGQMTLRTSLFDKTAEAVEAAGGPGDALDAWRRVAGYSGAGLDARAIRDAGVTTSGQPTNFGAPSPTWLASMALRFFPIVDLDAGSRAVGWQRVTNPRRPYANPWLIWPVWEPALDPPAVRTLLAHPALELAGDPGGRLAHTRELAALGVMKVFGSGRIRQAGKKGDGPLGPAVLLWSRDEA